MRGNDYDELPQVVVIMLLQNRLLLKRTKSYVNTCRMRWREEDGTDIQDGSSRLVFVLVELDKAAKRYNSCTEKQLRSILQDDLEAWIYLLTHGYKSEEAFMKVAEDFPTLEEFKRLYGEAMGDSDIVEAWRAAAWNESDRKSERTMLRREGFEQGLEQGRNDAYAELRKLGVSEDLLAKAAAAARTS